MKIVRSFLLNWYPALVACLFLSAAEAGEMHLVSPPYSQVALSPDGQHIASLKKGPDGSVSVIVVDTKELKVDPFAVSNGKGGTANVSDILWVGPDWLAVMADGEGGSNWLHSFRLGKTFPARLAKEGRRKLIGVRAESKILVAEWPMDDSVGACRVLEYDVEQEGEAKVVYECMAKSIECVLDGDGNLRMVKKQDVDGGDMAWYHIPRNGGEEVRLDVLKSWMRVYGVESGSDKAIIAGNLNTALPSIFAFDLSTDKPLEMLTDHASYAIDKFGEVVFDFESGKMVGLQIDATHFSSFWIDPDLGELQQKLDEKLAGSTNRIVGWSKGREKLLVERIFPLLPAQFLVANVKADSYSPVFLNGGPVKPNEVGPTRLVDIPNREGTAMPSLLTLPPSGFPRGDLPLVVWIRSGLWEGMDRLKWHPEANYLAAEGYAVLRINYRGGAGLLGPLAAETGSSESIARLFDDIEDAVKALVDAKLVDATKVVIAGEGVGAWAAAYGPVAKPGLFKASLCFNGLYDLVGYRDPEEGGEISGGMYLGFASKDSKLTGSEIASFSLTGDLGKYADFVFVTYGKWSPGPHTSQATSFMKSAKKSGATVKFYANNWWGTQMQGSHRIEALRRSVSFLKTALK